MFFGAVRNNPTTARVLVVVLTSLSLEKELKVKRAEGTIKHVPPTPEKGQHGSCGVAYSGITMSNRPPGS